MLHALRPGHLADVNQAFNSLLEFDERSVVGHADDASAHVSAYRITMLGIEPRIRRELLESQRHALLFLVVLENFHLDLVTDIHEVFGMGEASPGHVGDVQQTIEASEIDKSAILGEILDHSGEHRTFVEMLKGLGALLGLLAFQQFFARNHDVAALLVQLDNGDFDGLALHAVEIADRAQIHLRSGKKRMRAMNVYCKSALDAVDDHSLDWLLLVIGLLNFFPGVDPLCLLVREVNVALFRLALAAHDVDFVARLEFWLAVVIEHFRQRQHAFRFRANIHDHMSGRQLENGALNDTIFTDGLFGLGGEGLKR